MKKLLCIAFLFFAGQAYCQQCKYLRDADGQEHKIVYFPNTKDYYFCGDPATPRKKIAPGETLLDKDCDCTDINGPLSPTGKVQPLGPTNAANSNIQFDFDSSILRPASYPVLDAVAADLHANSDKKIELDGYASSEGTAAHNLRLANDRANSVKTYLVNSGVDSKRIKVKGYGETHPIADNSTEEGRILNRRVEFKME
jgi:outer membrane protein OmpA-like peptidoglycan-associated protein